MSKYSYLVSLLPPAIAQIWHRRALARRRVASYTPDRPTLAAWSSPPTMSSPSRLTSKTSLGARRKRQLAWRFYADHGDGRDVPSLTKPLVSRGT